MASNSPKLKILLLESLTFAQHNPLHGETEMLWRFAFGACRTENPRFDANAETPPPQTFRGFDPG